YGVFLCVAGCAAIVLAISGYASSSSSPTVGAAGCTDLISRLPPATGLSRDPVELATSNDIAKLPAAGSASQFIVQVTSLHTPDDYLANSHVADKRGRAAVMERDGFRGGVDVVYGSGKYSYNAFEIGSAHV